METIIGLLSYITFFLTYAGIFALLCLGLNIQWGYTGIFNIGIAGFFGVGAYTTALITLPPDESVQKLFSLNMHPFIGILLAGIVCGIMAFLVGFPALRLRKDYLAIASIGIAETIRLIFKNEQWLANGSRGLVGITQPFSEIINPRYYSYIFLIIIIVFIVAIFLIIERAIRSPWGRVLRAVREDELSASMSGKNTFAFKMQAFIFGAIIMGIAGALYAHNIRSISPKIFEPLMYTFLVWAMLMAGGSGNNLGAILGASLVWTIWEGTRFIFDYLPVEIKSRAIYLRYLVIGLLLVFIIVKNPKGILGEQKKISKLSD